MTYNALKTVLHAAGLDKKTSHKLAFEKWGNEFTPREKLIKLNKEKPLKDRIKRVG